MPYISQKFRPKFDKLIKKIVLKIDELDNQYHPGVLNYIISKILIEYLSNKEITYNKLNELVGVLECCKQEFYRRIIVPYEDEKILLNGDLKIDQNALQYGSLINEYDHTKRTKIQKIIIDWDDFDKIIDQIVKEFTIQNYKPDLIIGIARGGLVPATKLSEKMFVPLKTLSYSSHHGAGNDKNHENNIDINQFADYHSILIVDDIADTGHTLSEIVEFFVAQHSEYGFDIRTATLVTKEYKTVYKPDITGLNLTDTDIIVHQLNDPWIVFPWE